MSTEESIGIAERESIFIKRISYDLNILIGIICGLIVVDEEDEE